MKSPGVLLIDDHTAVRQALRVMLEAEADIAVVGEPNIGVFVSTSFLISSITLFMDAGSPGPFDKKIPSGLSATTSLADVSAGTTVTRHPNFENSRREFVFTPKSYATM